MPPRTMRFYLEGIRQGSYVYNLRQMIYKHYTTTQKKYTNNIALYSEE
jgi:hypothetical protein